MVIEIVIILHNHKLFSTTVSELKTTHDHRKKIMEFR